MEADPKLPATQDKPESGAALAPTGGSPLVELHCGACDWHGYGDPKDACYGCGEFDLREWKAWEHEQEDEDEW
jgi:hypothetical protein